jgi:hypothetical protein
VARSAGAPGTSGVTLVSVIIPAHNEEQVIDRCLSTLLGDAEPGEFEVLVVANGCTDATAEIAARHPGVRAISTPVASKPGALNLGDAEATSFPRIYVDADVEVDTATLRAVAAALQDGEHHVVSASLRMNTEGCPWPVRAYYDVWTRLPYVTDRFIGGGCYGLTEYARGLFEEFPDTMAEDFFVRCLVPAHQRYTTPGRYSTVHAPRTLASLVKIRTRADAANAASRELFAEGAEELFGEHRRALLSLLRDPRLAPKVPLYVGIVAYARLGAKRKNRSKTAQVWDRDLTTRTA